MISAASTDALIRLVLFVQLSEVNIESNWRAVQV